MIEASKPMNLRSDVVAFLVLTVVLAVASSVLPADAASPTYSDPAKAAADPDFTVQGEYAGDLKYEGGETRRLGFQVIALGDGLFHAVAYQGGLPGDGWDRGEKIEIESRRQAGSLQFEHEQYTARLEDGGFVVTRSGQPAGRLKKVQRMSPTLNLKPPTGAVILFDGSGLDHWRQGAARVDDGLLKEGCISKDQFQDQVIHIEFRLPYQPAERGQARGNSGVFVQGRYEVQMLDSFGLEGKMHECGGLYSFKDPDVNMCFPPLTWQTFDIEFTAARLDDQGNTVSNPRITVKHNGVVVHNDVEISRPLPTPELPGVDPKKGPGPIFLQDHGNPVRYRNVWVVPTKPDR